jgi:hypothetical protein
LLANVGWEIAHGPLRDARRFPSARWDTIPRATRTPGFGMCPYSLLLSFLNFIIQGTFSVAPRQTLALRFATFSSRQAKRHKIDCVSAFIQDANLPKNFTRAVLAFFRSAPHPTQQHTRINTVATGSADVMMLPHQLMSNTVRSFPTHGQRSAAQGSLTTVSRPDIRSILIFGAAASLRLLVALPRVCHHRNYPI